VSAPLEPPVGAAGARGVALEGVLEDKLAIRTRDGVALEVWRSLDPTRATADGPAVIVCHGFVQNRFSFQCERRSLFDHLRAAGFVVYALELRGRTGTPRAEGLADYVELDAPAVIEDVARRHRSVAWLGHSMGGIVGALVAGRAADDVDALVTIGTPLLPGPRRLHTRRTTSAAVRAARLAHLAGRKFEGRLWSGALYSMRGVLDEPRLPAPLRLWAPGSLDADALSYALRESFADDSWAVFADLLELLVTNGDRAGALDASARLARHERPALVIAGNLDDLAPPLGARPLFERIASVHKEYLEVGLRHGVHAGHIDLLIGDAAPHAVWGPITAFLRRHLGLAR
jgi:polyhydroxyalkanoate synthase subunit PhaC